MMKINFTLEKIIKYIKIFRMVLLNTLYYLFFRFEFQSYPFFIQLVHKLSILLFHLMQNYNQIQKDLMR